MTDPAMQALAEGRHGDPFALLGPHDDRVRVFRPNARSVSLVEPSGETPMQAHETPGLFVATRPRGGRYLVRTTWPDGAVDESEDPYAFGVLLGDLDLHLIGQGRHRDLASALGAQAMEIEGVAGVRFAVWAPNAMRASVVGDFNMWDGRRHPMRLRRHAGVWELFVPRLKAGARYKFELLDAWGTLLPQKADPLAREAEVAPRTASIVADPRSFTWTDAAWLQRRQAAQAPDAPISIYEMHANSFADGIDTWEALADRLIPHIRALGFTHLELLPVTVHPFGGSWGYQPLGLFAVDARLGHPADFARFVDRCHQAGIGVLVDWVPAHFPSDAHGLVQFDGTALYEHADPREGFHHDWNTLIYNFGRNEVRGFLIASALSWIERFHIDGLRVDAVASMLYRDYSRKHGEWIPNIHGGRENLEAVAFLRELNTIVAERCPGAIMVAEESTAWPGVTAPVPDGGLGFHYKWNMGWMHDTLRYLGRDPIARAWHTEDIRFGLSYAFSERYVLPLSHDEVVHGKGHLIARMPGDEWQRFANLRLLLALQWTHPGKKLLFMGSELAQPWEWNHDARLPWHLLEQPLHAGMQALVGDLNRLYVAHACLHALDGAADGFRWVIEDDAAQSVFAFLRQDGQTCALVVMNATPVPRHGYRIGVPRASRWIEALNSDAAAYGGSNLGNGGAVAAEAVPAHGFGHSVSLTLPPLAVLVLTPEN